LTDAPEVAAIYGEQPEFLEVMFPGDALDVIANAELQYWTGTRDKEGQIIDGALVCSGPGPTGDGTPGIAVWRDRNRTPPQEDCASSRDPRTGYMQRYCKGEGCCDWLDGRGFPKCKQTMRLYFIIPRVSPTNVYRITTHSWNTMFEVHRLLKWVKDTEGLAFKPFKLYKEAKTIKHWDSAKGKEFSRAMPILRIEKDDVFLPRYGLEIEEKLKTLRDSRFYLMTPPEPEPLLVSGESDMTQEAPEETPAQRAHRIANAVLAEADVQEGFAKLESAMDRVFDTKSRLMYIMKKSDAPDVKEAVLDGLTRSTMEVLAKSQPVMVEEVAPVTNEAAPISPEAPPAELLDKVDPLN
jgi:hypothetical protein